MKIARHHPDTRDAVLRLMAEGLTVSAACAELGIHVTSVYDWRRTDPDFRERYKEARIVQAHAMADQVIGLAEKPATTMVEVRDKECHIDALKWYVSKSAPRHYGDKVQHDHTTQLGVVVLPALDYSQQPIPALDATAEVKALPPGETE